ncbi:MAG TPA: ABC transporter permease [Propionibacteriaceae bacterium]
MTLDVERSVVSTPSPGPAGGDAARNSRDALVNNLVRAVIAVVSLGAWELVSAAFHLDFWISRPSYLFDVLGQWITNGYLWDNLKVTLAETAIGFAIGGLAGVGLGFLLGLASRLGRILEPFISALYSIPKLALAPLFVLWLGIGYEMKIALVALVVFLLMFWNCYSGARQRDRELINVLRVMGATRRDVVRRVVIPGAMPSVYVGFKLSLPYALTGAVVAEIVASQAGMGFVLMNAAGVFDTDAVFAALFVLMVVGGILNLVLDKSERIVLRWQRAGLK